MFTVSSPVFIQMNLIHGVNPVKLMVLTHICKKDQVYTALDLNWSRELCAGLESLNLALDFGSSMLFSAS